MIFFDIANYFLSKELIMKRFLTIILLFLFLMVVTTSSGCVSSESLKDYHLGTVSNLKTCYDNYIAMYSNLTQENKENLRPLKNSFEKLIRSAILRELERCDIKEKEKYLKFLEKVNPQTKTNKNGGWK